MQLAIFGIDDGPFNLAVSLLVFFLVVVWLALVYWTYQDARRRLEDSFLVACATAASLFPYLGTVVYTILRPPDYLEDAHERELEIRAAELRVRQLTEQACPNCEYPIERSYMRCPSCHARLKNPCPSCSKPLDPRWSMCPFCETPVQARRRRSSSREGRGARKGAAAPAAATKQAPSSEEAGEPSKSRGEGAERTAKGRPGSRRDGRRQGAGDERTRPAPAS
jgi:hypothetical protein